MSPLPEGGPGRLSLDLAYGFAALNHNGASVTFSGEDQPDLVERHYRNGLGARVALLPSEAVAAGLERHFGRLIGSGMRPLASLGLAADFSHFESGPGGDPRHDARGLGLELEIANVLALRLGHVVHRSQQIDGSSWGLGVGLPLGTSAGLRYDFASSPRAVGLARLHHQGLMILLDRWPSAGGERGAGPDGRWPGSGVSRMPGRAFCLSPWRPKPRIAASGMTKWGCTPTMRASGSSLTTGSIALGHGCAAWSSRVAEATAWRCDTSSATS